MKILNTCLQKEKLLQRSYSKMTMKEQITIISTRWFSLVPWSCL